MHIVQHIIQLSQPKSAFLSFSSEYKFISEKNISLKNGSSMNFINVKLSYLNPYQSCIQHIQGALDRTE